jgi:hypothetical protein
VDPAATAPNARAAALVHFSGQFTRQKGFLAVRHPSTGIYCLKLMSTINEDTLIASVTTEYDQSPQANITAQWRQTRPAEWIYKGLRTTHERTGRSSGSNGAA